jgi:hypothetical protein
MVEKRKIPRRKPDVIIAISDEINGKDLGHLANLTPEGFMLISRQPIPVRSIFQLGVKVPPSANRMHKIYFGAESVWASKAGDDGEYFWTGFSIIDISAETAEFIERWIQEWAVESQY